VKSLQTTQELISFPVPISFIGRRTELEQGN
jgi:hypothetical protein